MRTLAAACLVAGLVVPGTVSAQWGITAELGVARFGGSSRDTSGTTVGPYRPTTVELRLDRALGSARVAPALLSAKTGIAGEQPGLAVVQYDLASLWEVAPQVSFRLARFGAGVAVRLEAGARRPGMAPRRIAHRLAARQRRAERLDIQPGRTAPGSRAACDATIGRRDRRPGSIVWTQKEGARATPAEQE